MSEKEMLRDAVNKSHIIVKLIRDNAKMGNCDGIVVACEDLIRHLEECQKMMGVPEGPEVTTRE